MEIEETNEDDEKDISILEKSKINENGINDYGKSINQLQLSQSDTSTTNKFEHYQGEGKYDEQDDEQDDERNDERNDERGGENCNACEFCEDVCLLEFCKSCELKRKELYNKYKRYNLKIYQNKLNRSIILNARTHKNVLTNEYSKIKEVRDLSKSSESVHTLDSELKCKDKEKEDSQSSDSKNCENSKNENNNEKKKKKIIIL